MKWQDLLIQIVIYALFLLPVFFILRMWREVIAARRWPPLHVATLFAVTISQALLLAGLIEPGVLGPESSPRRSIIIALNAGLMAIALVLSLLIRSDGRKRLVMTSTWLACTWLIVGAVTSE